MFEGIPYKNKNAQILCYTKQLHSLFYGKYFNKNQSDGINELSASTAEGRKKPV